MTKNEARKLFIDYMYNELDIDTQQKLEYCIEKHPELKEELHGLMETKQLLKHMPVEDPKEQIVIMEPSSTYSSFTNWWENILSLLMPRSAFARFGITLASFAFLFIIAGSLTNMNIQFQEGNFSISFGEQPPQQMGYNADQVELLINQVQAENAQLVAEIVQTAQEQQEFQFQQTLESFAEYLDEQRNTDLQLIDYSLTSLEENTYNRFSQTDQVLGEIIETVSLNR